RKRMKEERRWRIIGREKKHHEGSKRMGIQSFAATRERERCRYHLSDDGLTRCAWTLGGPEAADWGWMGAGERERERGEGHPDTVCMDTGRRGGRGLGVEGGGRERERERCGDHRQAGSMRPYTNVHRLWAAQKGRGLVKWRKQCGALLCRLLHHV